MKFAEKLSAHLTPEWRIQYIQYEVRVYDFITSSFCRHPVCVVAPGVISNFKSIISRFDSLDFFDFSFLE